MVGHWPWPVSDTAGVCSDQTSSRERAKSLVVPTHAGKEKTDDVCEVILRALEKEGNIGEKYLVSADNLTWGELNRMVCEIASVPLPPLRLPDTVTVFNARLLTGLANLTKRPPLLDLSVDQVGMMKQGFVVDGSKAERELGLHYTPIRRALEEAIASF